MKRDGRVRGERKTTQVVALVAAPRRLHPNDTNKRSVIAGDRGRPTDPPADCRRTWREPTKEATADAGVAGAIIGVACNVLIERPQHRPACHSLFSSIPPHAPARIARQLPAPRRRRLTGPPTGRGRMRDPLTDCVGYAATFASLYQQPPPVPPLGFDAELVSTGI